MFNGASGASKTMDKVQHFEIPADDLERAGEFYSKVFGWKIQDSGMEGMDYHMLHTVEVDDKYMPKEAGAINGGMFPRTEQKEGPMIVITVEDVEAAVDEVKENGGEIVMDPDKVGDMGIYARIKDTEGNMIGLWENLKKHGE